MANPVEQFSRAIFWVSSILGGFYIFNWIGEKLGDYSNLAFFFIPFWLTGTFAVLSELRTARGSKLRSKSLLKDRPIK